MSHVPKVEILKRGGLRFVEPYTVTVRARVKSRWVGQPLLEVLSTNFRRRSRAYYEACLAAGRLLVDGKPEVDGQRRLELRNTLEHRHHVHEDPVPDVVVQILADTDEDIVAVDKPAGIPVHSSGNMHHNCVLEILREQHPLRSWHPVHRLDQPTSGVLLFATSRESARVLQQRFQARSMRKSYIARVAGRLDGHVAVTAPLIFRPGEPVSFVPSNAVPFSEAPDPSLVDLEDDADESMVEGPEIDSERVAPAEQSQADVVDRRKRRKLLMTRKTQGGEEKIKRAFTEVQSLAYDAASHTTLVRATPFSGRRHQIRVHLLSLGHPIANDILYNPAAVQEGALEMGQRGPDLDPRTLDSWATDPLCDECAQIRAQGIEFVRSASAAAWKRRIWLHAERYEDTLGNRSWSSPWPLWATAVKSENSNA